MTPQPEAILEQNLTTQLKGLGHRVASIKDEAALLANHLSKGNLPAKAKTLRDQFQWAA